MRVGLLTTSFPRWHGDVAGAFVAGFARALAARGHQLEVLAPEPRAGGPPPTWDGVRTRWVPYLRPRSLERTCYGAGAPENLASDPLAWLGAGPLTLAMWAAARRRAAGWDAVVSHWALPCGLIAGRVAAGRPHLAVLHSGDVHTLARLPGAARAARRLARDSRALVFTTRALRRRFLALLDPLTRLEVARSAHVSPMGIDPAPREPGARRAARRQLGLRGPTALSMGRLVPIKGLDVLLEAARRTPHMQWVVAGDGPLRTTLQRAAPANLRFVGVLSGETKRAWLQAADVFALPSLQLPSGRTEGLPHAVLEAMDAGLPVVASDVGGLADVVRDGHNGALVPPGCPRSLADAVTRTSDPARRQRMARHARATARLFHWPVLAELFEQFLEHDSITPGCHVGTQDTRTAKSH